MTPHHMASDQTASTDLHAIALLLAAGRSERMGVFKPLLPFGNTTVVESCITNLAEGGVDNIVVVVGYRADELRARLQQTPIRVAVNPEEASEMNVSIAYGVRSITETAGCVLVALVDHPAVERQVVKDLLEKWRSGSKLIIPTWKGSGGHPVLIDLSFREELLNLPPKGGLKAFFEFHRDEVLRLPVNSPYIARDIDTWDDYVELHKDVFGDSPQKLSD